MADAEQGSNGAGTMLLRWIMGIGAAALLFFVSTSVSRFDAHDRRINTNEIAIGKLTDGVISLIDLTRGMRNDQIERLVRFGELGIKVNTLEQKVLFMDERMKMIANELDTIRYHLETLRDQKRDDTR